MRKLIRYVCILMVVVTCLSATAVAAEATPKASSYFWSSSVYLYKTSGTTFQAWFDVQCFGIMEEVGASVIKIQRSSDGINWTTVKTYTKEAYSSLIDYNTATHASYVTYTGTAGYYYRAYIELYAKNGSGSAYMPEYTSSIQF